MIEKWIFIGRGLRFLITACAIVVSVHIVCECVFRVVEDYSTYLIEREEVRLEAACDQCEAKIEMLEAAAELFEVARAPREDTGEARSFDDAEIEILSHIVASLSPALGGRE